MSSARHTSHAGLARILTFWFGVVALFACVTLGVLTYVVQSRNVREQMYHQLETLRDEKTSSIAQWAAEREADVEVASRRHVVTAFCEAKRAGATPDHQLVQRALRQMQRAYRYHAVFLSNTDGEILTHTGRAEDIGHDYFLRRPHEKLAAKERRVVVSDVIAQPLHDRPTMLFLAPVFSPSSAKVIATIGVLIDLKKDLFPFLHSVNLGDTGEILLINSAGIAQSPLKYRANAVMRTKLSARPAKLAARGSVGRIIVNDYRPVRVMAAYGYIAQLDWGIVVKRDVAEISQPILATARSIGLTSLAVLVLTIVGGIGIARTISAPAATIAAASDEIGGGTLDITVPDKGPAELRTIANNLNAMVELLARQRRFRVVTSDIFEAAGKHSSLAELLAEVLAALMSATRSQAGVVYLSRDSGGFERVLVHGTDSADLPELICSTPPDHWLGVAATKGDVQLIQDIPQSSGLSLRTQAGDAPPKSLLSIPLMLRDAPICVVGLASVHDYRDEDLDVAGSMRTKLGQYVELTIATGATRRMAGELDNSNKELLRSNQELEARTTELQQQATSLQQQAAELEVQRTQVQAADRMKSQFLSTMSHELRTPLSAVLSLSQMMIARGTGHDVNEEREFLQVIERNGRDLLQLINSILDLSKIEAGGMTSHTSVFDASVVVDRAVATIRPLAEQKQLVVSFPSAPLAKVSSDEGKVHQIVLNLLSNAVKFTEQGRVDVTMTTVGPDLHIAVGDTGIGIKPDDLENIFDEFRQADGSTTRRYEGTGLGLAISRKLAHVIGAELTVRSVVGQGSTFTLVLPLAKPQRKPAHDTTLPRILVVEDKPDNLVVIESLLSEVDCTIATAANGLEALQSVRDQPPDVILMDMQMPVLSGDEATRRLKADPAFAAIPIIAVTARAMSGDREKLLAAGCDDYVSKPIDAAAFLGVVRQWLG